MEDDILEFLDFLGMDYDEDNSELDDEDLEELDFLLATEEE